MGRPSSPQRDMMCSASTGRAASLFISSQVAPALAHVVLCPACKCRHFEHVKAEVLETGDAGGGRNHQVFGVEDFMCVLLLLAQLGGNPCRR